LVAEIILVNMTHLTITEDPGEEFVFRGINTVTGLRDDGVIFYADVTKVHVVPERETFTIQVITPALDVDMDFADADRVRKALELFETKKVLEVNSDPPGFVRITPSLGKTEGYGELRSDRTPHPSKQPSVAERFLLTAWTALQLRSAPRSDKPRNQAMSRESTRALARRSGQRTSKDPLKRLVSGRRF
jgi:hypothetical protein